MWDRVTEIDPSGELVTVLFDDRIAAYTTEMLSELELAYAVTVHKAQGSEYKAVILAAAPCAPTLMVRNVLYTAITRARDLADSGGRRSGHRADGGHRPAQPPVQRFESSAAGRKESQVKLLDRCLDLLYPPRCVFCDTLLQEGRTFLFFAKAAAKRSQRREGRERIRTGVYFDRCVAPLLYQDMVRESFLDYKFHQKTWRAAIRTPHFWSRTFGRRSRALHVATWVPLGRRSRRKTGATISRSWWQRGWPDDWICPARGCWKRCATPSSNPVWSGPSNAEPMSWAPMA